jgi:predicted DNA-binding protein (UPF0251 family)
MPIIGEFAMGRPFKCRHISGSPGYTFFKPAGIPGHSLEEIKLTIDEFEAVRLVDLQGLYQEQAAEKMDISRQTLGNIINSAHQKIADCIVNGKAIRIAGGVFAVGEKRIFRCFSCAHEWSVPFGTGCPGQCPNCRHNRLHRVALDRNPIENSNSINSTGG